MSRHWSTTLILGLCPFLCAFVTIEPAAPRLEGRLFHSRDQRAHLDRRRFQTSTRPRAPERKRLSLDGVVWHGAGPALIWINGDLVEPGKQIRAIGTDAVLIQLANGKQLELRVGDIVEVDAQAGLP